MSISTIQPGAADGIDGGIADGSYASSPLSGATMTIGNVNTAGVDVRNRAYFTLSLATLGRQPILTSAPITLTAGPGGQLSGATTTIRLYLVDVAMSELATWLTSDGSTAWSTQGGDFGLTPVATWTGPLAQNLTFSAETLFRALLRARATAGVFMLVGDETPGASNYLTVYTSDEVLSTRRPKAVVTFTPVPVVDQIAQQIVTRLELITTANGYSFDAVVNRPARLGQNYKASDKEIVVTLGARQGLTDVENGIAVTRYQQEFLIVPFAVLGDRDTSSVDQLILLREAEAVKALTDPEAAGADWMDFDGLSFEAEFDTPTEYLDPATNQPLANIIHLLVSYSHPTNDPFTVSGIA